MESTIEAPITEASTALDTAVTPIENIPVSGVETTVPRSTNPFPNSSQNPSGESDFLGSLDQMFAELNNTTEEETALADTEPTKEDISKATLEKLINSDDESDIADSSEKAPASAKSSAKSAKTAEISNNEEVDPEAIAEDPLISAMTPKARKAFKAIKAEAKELKITYQQTLAEKEALAQRVAEFEALQELGDASKLKEQILEMERELSITRIEATPEYKRGVMEPLREIVVESDEIAAKYGVDPEKLSDVLSITDPDQQDAELEKVLSGFRDRDKMKIYTLASKASAVLALQRELFTNSQAALRELEVSREQQRSAELARTAKERADASKLVAERIRAKLPFLADDKFGFDGVVKSAAADTSDVSDHTRRAYNAVAGGLLPKLAAAYAKVSSELESLRAEQEKVRSAEPGAGGGLPRTNASGTRQAGSFLDAVFAATGT